VVGLETGPDGPVAVTGPGPALLLTDSAPADRPWALGSRPLTRSGLPAALTVLADIVDHDPAVVAVHGGTALTRTLLCEQARMKYSVPALLVEDEPDADLAVTAVLSGRADLVGAPMAIPHTGAGASVIRTVTGPDPARQHSSLAPLFAPRGYRSDRRFSQPGKARRVVGAVAAWLRRPRWASRTRQLPRQRHVRVGERRAAAGPVDLAMICVPAAACPQVLADAAAAGARAAVVCGGGFAEAGGEGIGLQRELASVVAGAGIRLLGPNTSGFLSPPAGLSASFVPGVAAVPAGRVAVVAASGGVNHALAFLLTEAGQGLSLAVGLGNAVDVTAPDVLDYLAADPQTTAVALHVESVADGPRLVRAVRALTARTPVVALVVGRNDIGAFAASHTGALATSWRTTRAALAQAGAVLVDDERELVDAVGALAIGRAGPGPDPGVGVVTAQAGPGLLLLDDLRGRRAEVPNWARPPGAHWQRSCRRSPSNSIRSTPAGPARSSGRCLRRSRPIRAST